MQITFLGAVREVTGSMHLISSDTSRILLDCGMFQGRRKESAEKNRVLAFDPQIITNVVISSGKTTNLDVQLTPAETIYIPLLIRE